MGIDKICETYGCDYVALTCAIDEADADAHGAPLAEVAARWEVPIGAVSAGVTARRRWRVRRGEPAIVVRPAGGVVVAS